jgi:hypothetical protein
MNFDKYHYSTHTKHPNVINEENVIIYLIGAIFEKMKKQNQKQLI